MAYLWPGMLGKGRELLAASTVQSIQHCLLDSEGNGVHVEQSKGRRLSPTSLRYLFPCAKGGEIST